MVLGKLVGAHTVPQILSVAMPKKIFKPFKCSAPKVIGIARMNGFARAESRHTKEQWDTRGIDKTAKPSEDNARIWTLKIPIIENTRYPCKRESRMHQKNRKHTKQSKPLDIIR